MEILIKLLERHPDAMQLVAVFVGVLFFYSVVVQIEKQGGKR